jgi:hypothetical protein
MHKFNLDLNTPDEILSYLEKETPLIDSGYNYKRELTEDEIRQYEGDIAKLTIGIMNDQERQKEITDRIKAATQERGVMALVLESGEIDEIGMAVKFYKPSERLVDIYIKNDDGYKYLHSRTATPSEIEEWKRRQEEIKQTEIEAGAYRQQLQMIAGYEGDKANL